MTNCKCNVTVGKHCEKYPKVHNPCEGALWLNHKRTKMYVFNNCEWKKIRLEDHKCCEVLLDYDFSTKTVAQIEADWPLFAGFGNDGWANASVSANGLTVPAVPFTFTSPIGNDHPKMLRYYKNQFDLSDTEELIYEGHIAAEQFIPVQNIPAVLLPRIRNIYEDIRLCSAAMNVLDSEFFIVFDIFLSSEKIYCFVERLPFGKTPTNNYAAFSNAIAVIERAGNGSPITDVVPLKFAMTKSYTKFFVNDQLVYTADRIGIRLIDEYRVLDHGGVPQIIKPNKISVGFGLFSLMDMFLPYNFNRSLVVGDNEAASGLIQLDNASAYGELLPGQLTGDGRPIIDPTVSWAVTLNQFPNNNHDIKLFGQGCTILVKDLKVSRCPIEN